MDTPPKLHSITVQQSSNSYPSTLISTSLILPLLLLYLLSLFHTHMYYLTPCLSLSLCHMSNCLSVKLTGFLIPHESTNREGEGQRIRGIIDMLGGVKSACSTTAIRSRGCRQMHRNLQKAQTRVQKTTTKISGRKENRKWREIQREKQRQTSYNTVHGN